MTEYYIPQGLCLVDVHKNRASVSYWGSLENALAALQSLEGCKYCDNCKDCKYCQGCVNCENCRDCKDCCSSLSCWNCVGVIGYRHADNVKKTEYSKDGWPYEQ